MSPPYTNAMAYASVSQVKSIGMMAAFFTGDLAPSDDQISFLLENVAAQMDSLIVVNPNISLPLSEPYDPTLVQSNVDIVRWKLLVLRGYNPENPSDRAIRLAHDDAMKWLDKIANGRAKLQHQVTQPQALGVQPDVAQNEDRGLRNWSGFVGSGGWR